MAFFDWLRRLFGKPKKDQGATVAPSPPVPPPPPVATTPRAPLPPPAVEVPPAPAAPVASFGSFTVTTAEVSAPLLLPPALVGGPPTPAEPIQATPPIVSPGFLPTAAA